MNLFKKLFKKKNVYSIDDANFGIIQGMEKSKETVVWEVKITFLNHPLEVQLDGDKQGVDKTQKQILLNALKEENKILKEAEKALREELEKGGVKLNSMDAYFEEPYLSVYEDGFELSFQQKEEPYYNFNVQFENNEQVGVSIDS